MSDRELIIHAVQHLEDISERLEGIGKRLLLVEEIHAELTVFLPLLRELAPGGRVTLGAIMRARRGQQGGARVFPGIQ